MAEKELKTLSAKTRRLLDGPESTEVDFKEYPDGVKSEAIVAFANNQGGVILVGVAEHQGENGRQCGKVVGCKITDKVRQSIELSARD